MPLNHITLPNLKLKIEKKFIETSGNSIDQKKKKNQVKLFKNGLQFYST